MRITRVQALPACYPQPHDNDNLRYLTIARREPDGGVPGSGKRGEARLGVEPKRDIAFVQAAREAIGDDVELMIDIGNGVKWDTAHAIRMGREFARFNLRWYEEPLHPTNHEGYARLRRASDLSIATGEREWTVAGYRQLVQSGV